MKSDVNEIRIGKRVLQVAMLAAATIALILPVVLAPVNLIKTSAMLAYALIFQNIITGSAGLPFYRLYKAKYVYRYHMVSGIAGFALALVHGVLILVDRTMSIYSRAWIIGPVSLAFLAVAIFAALFRKRLRKLWRRIHQVNYAIFAALTVKALLIGSAVRSTRSLLIIVYVYASLALLGLCYRLFRYFSSRRKKAARTVASP